MAARCFMATWRSAPLATRSAAAAADIGPDLSNLVHRDYASVCRDIHSPGAAINPDYVPQRIALSDGRVLEGVIHTDGDRLIVGDTNGRRTVIDRAQVDAMAPSSISIMPEGLDLALGPDRVRDLLTFLLTDPAGSGQARRRRCSAAAPAGRSRCGSEGKRGDREPDGRSASSWLPGRKTTGRESMITPRGASDGRPCWPLPQPSSSRRLTAGRHLGSSMRLM